MGEEQRQALVRLISDNENFRLVMSKAQSIDDAVRIARDYGIEVTAEDFARSTSGELSDAELEGASGGGMEDWTIRTGQKCWKGYG